MTVNLLLMVCIFGLVAGSALPVLPSFICLPLFFLASLLLFLLYSLSRRHQLILQRGWLYAAVFCMGFSWALFYGHRLFAQRLPDHYASEDFLVEGRVINLPEQTERGERFDLAVDRVLHSSIPIIDDIRFNTLRLNSYQITPLNQFSFVPGQRWRLWVRLKPPRGMANPYGFDYEGWLLQQGYSAVGYVRSSSDNMLLPDQSLPADSLLIKTIFDHWGFTSLQWINTHIENLDQRALFAAIALGYKEEFTRHHWDLLKNTGTIHLVVVSGLNIVLAASLGYFMMSWFSRLLFFPLYFLPAPIWGAFGAIVLAVFYAGMTGLSLPTQRSLIMVLCGLVTLLFRRQIAVSTGFLTALALVLAYDPLAAFSASLWLSFGAVALLLYGFGARIYGQSKKWDVIFFLKQWIYTQSFVSLGLFPLLAYWMGSVPLVMPIANLFAVPFATFVLLPLTIISGFSFIVLPVLGESVLQLCGWCMDLFWWFLQFMQQFNINWYMAMGNMPRGDVSPVLVLIISIVAVVILLIPRGVVPRYYGIFLLLPLLCPNQHKLPLGEFEVTVIDVGQGLGVLVETTNTLSVYDVGDRYSDQFDIGRDVVAQLIRRKGYNYVDTLIISHGDSDHAGGLKGLLGEMPSIQLLSGDVAILQQRLANEIDTRYADLSITPCLKGQQWLRDQVRFEIVSPAENQLAAKRNNHSCVLKISNTHFSALLTGDIEANLENALLSDGASLNADMLLVPHHGSKTSSSPAFLQAVTPALAVVSVGYKSQYGHPHHDVVERYRDFGIRLWRTDQQGAITVTSTAWREEPHLARFAGLGYWRRW